MESRVFWKTVTLDRSEFRDRLLAVLGEHRIRYCVVDGHAVNAYAEPVVSLDFDFVVAAEQLPETERILRQAFTVERFPHKLNVSSAGSGLRAQIQTDARYFPFVDRAVEREVLGVRVPVAALEDVLQGKIASKHLKDLSDIARLLEGHPQLRARVPADVLSQLRQWSRP